MTINKPSLKEIFEKILKQEKISDVAALLVNFEKHYLPLADWIAKQHCNTSTIIGINGPQGSGKSTLCKILSAIIENRYEMKVITLSIDDLYKTKQQRQLLSKTIHPLLKTRGVPGTHDIELGMHVLQQLKAQKPVRVPVFDKAIDNRLAEKEWLQVNQKVDIILFEGWCVGSRPEDDTSLDLPINSLEKNEDANTSWRQYVNQQLSANYQDLFSLIDRLIMLNISNFSKVTEWRALQEKKLKSSTAHKDNNQILSGDELNRFIMHFERITTHTLKEMPARADVVLEINDEHQISETIWNTSQ